MKEVKLTPLQKEFLEAMKRGELPKYAQDNDPDWVPSESE